MVTVCPQASQSATRRSRPCRLLPVVVRPVVTCAVVIDPAKLAEFRERDALTFPLVGDPTRETLVAYGAYGEKQLYGKTVIGVIRSTYVIDALGVIEPAMYNVKATGHVAKLRRDLGL